MLGAEVHQFGIFAAALGAVPGRAAASLEHAGDPDDVALAIEKCIGAADPPARIVVGADAQEMITMIQDATPTRWPRSCASTSLAAPEEATATLSLEPA